MKLRRDRYWDRTPFTLIIVEAIAERNFKVMSAKKSMVKLSGGGVFATRQIGDRAFETGLGT